MLPNEYLLPKIGFDTTKTFKVLQKLANIADNGRCAAAPREHHEQRQDLEKEKPRVGEPKAASRFGALPKPEGPLLFPAAEGFRSQKK